jgi:hypothetical protein
MVLHQLLLLVVLVDILYSGSFVGTAATATGLTAGTYTVTVNRC